MNLRDPKVYIPEENLPTWEQASQGIIIPREKVEEVALNLRRSGKTIVTLNGSFDLMHAGHLYMIHRASLLADCLILALNTDRSIQNYKSKDRPIVPLKWRLQMAAALRFVSYVTSFDEPDPRAILELIKPDIHVNGAEWGQNCIEREVVERNGGKLHIVERIEGLSTTELIAKIQTLTS